MNDITGRPIQPGNIIAYPQRQGSSMWVKIAMVTETGRKTPTWSNTEMPFVRVIACPTQRWNEEPGEQFERNAKTSVLTAVENIVVIAADVNQLNLPEPNQTGFAKICNQFWNNTIIVT